uniref:Polyketide synthase dehydratase domain-containing protein n=1 Tax=Acrobeloides nanus TaxID=290746 RepID=A0A914D6U6_9BILA
DVDPFSFDTKEGFMLDHVVGGRLLYPFTGFIVLAWRAICKFGGTNYLTTSVVLENFVVHRAVFITRSTQLDVIVSPCNGNFEILNDGQLSASGKIFIVENGKEKEKVDENDTVGSWKNELDNSDLFVLQASDIYKEFLLRGYEFGPSFRCIEETRSDGLKGTIRWQDNWVTFLDATIQTLLIADKRRSSYGAMKLPTKVRYLSINPTKHMQHVLKTG